MFQVRSLLRGCLLITAALVLLTCSGYNSRGGGNTGLTNPCGAGVGKEDNNAPIVCVDDTAATLSVHPDPITAHSRDEKDRMPVMLHWWTRSGGKNLSLEIEPGCVTEVKCAGGHCSARTLPTETKKQCKYSVWTDKHPKLDPDIVVDPCC